MDGPIEDATSPQPAAHTHRRHLPRLVLSSHAQAVVHGTGAVGRFNTRLALRVTTGVGSMWCAYAFALLALISLPAAIRSGDPIVIVGWIAQTRVAANVVACTLLVFVLASVAGLPRI